MSQIRFLIRSTEKIKVIANPGFWQKYPHKNIKAIQ